MKFDPFKWQEVKPNVETQSPQGLLRLRASARGALFITAQGYEALAGCGEDFEVKTAEPVTFRFEAPKGTRVFIEAPDVETVRAEGEVYTNADRMVHESGSVLAVKQALRQFELERRAMLAEVRAERAKLKAEAEAVKASRKGERQAEQQADQQAEQQAE